MSEQDTNGVAARFQAIQRGLEAACSRADRQTRCVTLVGASKRQPIENLLEAWNAGLKVFGENRVQEAKHKAPLLANEVDWHLIGPLQTNKARQAVQLFSTIHSVDRLKVARALEREAIKAQKQLDIFLQVNIGQEESKHGFTPLEVASAAQELAAFDSLRLVGLMAIPPFEADPEQARQWFRRLRELRDETFSNAVVASLPGWLSMGMSHDFETAIEEGATHVRVGSALFGARAT